MDDEHCAIATLLLGIAKFLSAADKTPLQRLSYMSCRSYRTTLQNYELFFIRTKKVFLRHLFWPTPSLRATPPQEGIGCRRTLVFSAFLRSARNACGTAIKSHWLFSSSTEGCLKGGVGNITFFAYDPVLKGTPSGLEWKSGINP